MKNYKSTFKKAAIAVVIAASFVDCISQGTTINLSGRAVNPRKKTGTADYAMTEKTVKRIEAVPQAPAGKDGVETGFFTSTSKVDASGNFTVAVSPGVRTLLVATLADGTKWQTSVDAKDKDTALGDVAFVDPKTTVFNLCWSANDDHDTRLLNTSSGSHWGYSGTGSTSEAQLDFDDTSAAGCENITLVQDTGSKYVFAVARFNNTIDFRTVSVPQAKLITGNGITTVTASPSSTGCGAADRWWAAFSYQNGVVTVLNKCSSDTSSNAAIPAAIQN